jgi:hypothetical protein
MRKPPNSDKHHAGKAVGGPFQIHQQFKHGKNGRMEVGGKLWNKRTKKLRDDINKFYKS